MRDDARKFTQRIKYQGSIERLNVNAMVPRGWMVETPLGQPTRYRVFGQATFYDELDERYYTQKVSFYTDDYTKTGNYGVMFEETYKQIYSNQQLEFMGFKTIGLEHNAGYGY